MIEEQPVNTILTTLHATDADSTISEYQLIDADDGDNGSEFFEINNVTGECKNAGLPQNVPPYDAISLHLCKIEFKSFKKI